MENIKNIKNIIKYAIMACCIVLSIFIALLYLRAQSKIFLKKDEAINLCKHIMYAKINNKLKDSLYKVSYNNKYNYITVVLMFIIKDLKIEKSKNTTAKCEFNSRYNKNKDIVIKNFFYQDVNNTTYIYSNVLVKIKDVN